MIGKPWLPVPASRPVKELDDLARFTEPGWLKYGMEWSFTGTDDGRTLVETATLCEATSRSATLFFGAYWAVIRGFSGLLRREMLRGLGSPTVRWRTVPRIDADALRTDMDNIVDPRL